MSGPETIQLGDANERKLVPGARALLTGSLKERKQYIEKPFYFPTSQSDRILALLRDALQSPPRDRMPHLLIYGETNVGKSHMIKAFCRETPPIIRPEEETDLYPVISVQLNNASESRFYFKLLSAIDCDFGPGNADALYRITVKALKAVQPRMLILDEVQTTTTDPNQKRKKLFNAVRDLAAQFMFAVVLVGTDDAKSAIAIDRHLNSRFRQYAIKNWGLGPEWEQIMAKFEAFLPLRHASELWRRNLAEEIYDLSDGLLGEAHQVIKEAAVRAMESGAERITLKILKELNYVPLRRRA